MDRGKLQKKVFVDLLSAPWTLGPAVLGASALLVSWAAELGSPWLTMAGIGGLLAGVGSLATQWIFRSDELIRQAWEELDQEALAADERKLDELHKRLRQDKDARDEDSLQELRTLYRSIKTDKDLLKGLSAPTAVEIVSKVEKLYKGCIMSLERSAELVESAGKMGRSKAKTGLLEAREQLLGEVFQSVEQLAKTIESVKLLAANDTNPAQLSRIRHELDESLEVAKRVEERMHSLDQELGAAEKMREP